MDNLHNAIRTIKGETRRRDHLSVFREFIGQLERIGRRPSGAGRRGATPSRRKAAK
jgi:hypothetical protein